MAYWHVTIGHRTRNERVRVNVVRLRSILVDYPESKTFRAPRVVVCRFFNGTYHRPSENGTVSTEPLRDPFEDRLIPRQQIRPMPLRLQKKKKNNFKFLLIFRCRVSLQSTN